MDSFTEQLVKKTPTTADHLKQAGSIALGVLIFLVMIRLGFLFRLFTVIFVAIGLGAVWLGWYLSREVNVEYEYIFVNGDLDIDKIVAQRRRKRLISIKANQIEQLHRYDPQKDNAISAEVRVVAAASLKEKGAYTAVFTHKKYGRCVLFFTPEEKLLTMMQPFLPRELRDNQI